jgi:uncharacterized protein (TIGR02118 family)
MIKLMYCLRRKPGVSRADFQHYWRTTHAPLVAGVAETLGVRRYVQSHTIATGLDDAIAVARGCTVEPYDGVAELWWDDEASLIAGADSETGQQAGILLLKDEANFIDFERSAIFFVSENEVVTG